MINVLFSIGIRLNGFKRPLVICRISISLPWSLGIAITALGHCPLRRCASTGSCSQTGSLVSSIERHGWWQCSNCSNAGNHHQQTCSTPGGCCWSVGSQAKPVHLPQLLFLSMMKLCIILISISFYDIYHYYLIDI